MSLQKEYFSHHFQKLIIEITKMIESGFLRKDEIERFQNYIFYLKDDSLSFEKKKHYAIQIEEILKYYRDFMMICEEKKKKGKNK